MSGDDLPGKPTRSGRSTGTPGRAPKRQDHLDWVRIMFLAVLGVWVTIPFAAASGAAQDALPYVAAGRIVSEDPGSVYPESGDRHGGITPAFEEEYCSLLATDAPRCDQVAVAFLATPLALPFAVALSPLSATAAGLVMRLGAALLLAAGMHLVWRRLAHRTPNARAQMLIATVALTPLASTAIGFAQTSPLMFVSVVLGLGATTRAGKALSVLAWVGAGVFKAFPAALVMLLAWLRRWRFLGAAAFLFALLGLLTLFVAPVTIVGDFLASLRAVSATGAQGSIGRLVQEAVGAGGTGENLGRLAAVALGLVCCWFGFRGTTPDVRWAAGYLALVVASPLFQVHYLWVPLGAVAVTLAAQRRLTDGALAVFPILAVLTIPPSLVADPTKGMHPTYQALVLGAAAVTFMWYAQRSRHSGRRPTREVPA